MVDYTKFKLKKEDELVSLLEGKDNLFVIACNKCFKEFELSDEPECAQLEEIATGQGKTIVGCAKIDFLCNKTTTLKTLESKIPADAENVFVISCGLGIQTMADELDKPVYAAADSIMRRGKHGMALTEIKCDACGQCYLNLTGGICPVVDCSKGLLNGQCGGEKNGKCEVDPEMDCGWLKIYQKMESQGRVAELQQPVQLRDYSKVNYNLINAYVKSVREGRFEGYYGGIHPTENKEYSEHIALVDFPAPKVAVIPVSQHIGAYAKPIVEVNDQVKVGQKIAEADGVVSASAHASVSGTVIAIEPRIHPTSGAEVLSVVIESDGKNTLDESVKPAGTLDSLSAEDIIEIVRDKGIVGMGGAGFPTAVKLKVPNPVDVVILNGCECEPLLTADDRLMVEYADDVIFGLLASLKATGAPKGVIAVEDNKPEAIEILEAKTADMENIEVVVAKTKYPQGAEKMLIKRVLQREVPCGGLPCDVGAVVCNVSTVKAISDAIQTGMPLIERIVTVTGERINKPGNFNVKIGTPIGELIEYCGGVIKEEDTTIKLGGPMMGFEPTNFDVPIIKATNGIIAIETVTSEPIECIKCGRCADVCPMMLKPLYFSKYSGSGNLEGLAEQNIMDCIECGSCQYICSSKIPLVNLIKFGKKLIREAN